jgi:uncharacterized membrane protein
MPFGSDSTSKVEILRCRDCQEFIASDAARCRFCGRQFDSMTITAGVAATRAENNRYRRDYYLKHMLVGLTLFAVFSLITFGTFWAASRRNQGYFVVFWGFIIAGLGDFIYGLYGYLGGVLSKK